MIIVDVFLFLLLLIVSFFLLYLLVLASKAVILKYDDKTSTEAFFYVLVPVHNEADVIDLLINSIKEVNYPQEQLEVLFIADHCSDASADIIKSAGFKVIERNSGDRGKPAAIAEGVACVLPKLKNKHDAIAFFDADNIIHKDFFRHVAHRLTQGIDVIQGNTVIDNHSDTLFLRVNHLNMTVTNRFKELARYQWGGCCRLRGHGMVFSRSILETIEWETSSLVEDQKMLLDLVLNDISVCWDHKAKVSSVFPATMEAAAIQRMRWSGGKSIMIKPAVKSLFNKFIKDKDFAALDMMVDFIMPSYAILVGLSFIGLVLSFFFYGFSLMSLGFLTTTIIFLTYYFMACYKEGLKFKNFVYFFSAPFFILWRIWIYIRSLNGPGAWR